MSSRLIRFSYIFTPLWTWITVLPLVILCWSHEERGHQEEEVAEYERQHDSCDDVDVPHFASIHSPILEKAYPA